MIVGDAFDVDDYVDIEEIIMRGGEDSMALIDVDTDYEQAEKEAEFSPLPEGTYDCQVSAWDLKSSKDGNPMILWSLEVINHAELNGRILFTNTPTTGKGRNFLTRFAQACNKPWVGKQIDPDSYIGCQVKVDVSEDLYQGKKVNKIDAISSM